MECPTWPCRMLCCNKATIHSPSNPSATEVSRVWSSRASGSYHMQGACCMLLCSASSPAAPLVVRLNPRLKAIGDGMQACP